MIKSKPICAIKEANQLSAIKIVICFSYAKSGTNNSSTLRIYGLGKGDRVLLASAKLETKGDYIDNEPASCIIERIPAKEYPYIQWEIDTADGFRLRDMPQVILSVNSELDFPNPDIIQKVE